ncbi:sialidase-1 [Friedmanniella endophytica]|uniref:exo-alpha-sialidase n=1 Tax=Microlunatus kandeliicorticis TaxID=1759536 RepID=A0A7W3ITE6_9ACTN|nr:sialidase family protein [Microlunatus kandeliicorticis]MBA8794912.1 sialidase-1 [Microlunatus kandeliicorticis]
MRQPVAVALAGLLTAGLVTAAPGPTPASATPARRAATTACVATVFRSVPSQRVWYRIPALVTTGRGTLVAFAERRRSTGAASDVSDTEIVTARSTDRGCHWSRPRVIADLGGGTVGNPAPVVDRVTGQVLLFSVYRPRGGTTNHGFHVQRSSDDGRTFTPYRRAGVDLAGTPRWAGGLTGPGHAIQLRSAAGGHPVRIVVPMGFKQDNRYGGYAVISDDHGRTWSVGYKQTSAFGPIEGTAAELPDGRVWISYRNRNSATAAGKARVSGFAVGAGTRLSGGLRNAGLPTVAVQGSSLALTGRYAGMLLFSSPTGRTAGRRENMGVFVSRGSGVGRVWRKPVQVQPGRHPAAYSDLTQLDGATVGLLYETGRSNWTERIDFRALALARILG